jgi:hypothetical protein
VLDFLRATKLIWWVYYAKFLLLIIFVPGLIVSLLNVLESLDYMLACYGIGNTAALYRYADYFLLDIERCINKYRF